MVVDDTPAGFGCEGSDAVTVAAADVALGDLRLERCETAPESKPADVASLVAKMVEVEHDRIILATVHASLTPKNIDQVLDIAPLRRGPPCGRDPGRAVEAAANRSPSTVAVDAHHVTPLQLLADAFQAAPGADPARDGFSLLSRRVVELQREELLLAAVEATPFAEVLQNEGPSGLTPAHAPRSRLVPVTLPAVAEVLAEASATPNSSRA